MMHARIWIRILFMDDDDIMLEKPSIDIGVVLSHCYVPAFDDGCMIQDEKSMRECLDQCATDIDFCGSMAPLSVVRLYFNIRKPERVCAYMEDCSFMRHLKKHDAISPNKPYIFYRQWPNSHDWMSSMSDELRVMGEMITSLAKQYL